MQSEVPKADERPPIFVLVMIAAMSSVNIAILSPSLAEISDALKAPYSQVQILLSGYMIMTAIMQLFLGPLSDIYGRRPVLLGGLVVFLVGTVLCMFAPTIELLIAGRMVQATVIAGLVLSRAIVRDVVPMKEAASMLGYVTMGMTLAPMLAPVLGGALASTFGWQANFMILFAFGVVVLAVVHFGLRETNRNRSGSVMAQFKAWPHLLGNKVFWAYCMAATFTSGIYFSFLGGAPYVGDTQLGMSQSALGIYFGSVSVGYIFGNWVSGRFAVSWGPVPLMMSGAAISLVGAVLPAVLFMIGLGSPIAFFGPMLFVGIGNGMAVPSANAGIVSVRPDLAGAASGLGGALTIGGGAALSVLGAAVLSPVSGPIPLLAVMAASAALSLAGALLVRLLEKGSGQ